MPARRRLASPARDSPPPQSGPARRTAPRAGEAGRRPAGSADRRWCDRRSAVRRGGSTRGNNRQWTWWPGRAESTPDRADPSGGQSVFRIAEIVFDLGPERRESPMFSRYGVFSSGDSQNCWYSRNSGSAAGIPDCREANRTLCHARSNRPDRAAVFRPGLSVYSPGTLSPVPALHTPRQGPGEY